MGAMIRNGNHFILIDDRWCLIGGPWFTFLSAYHEEDSFVPIRVPLLSLTSFSIVEFPAEAIYGPFPVAEWLPMRWYPAHRNPWPDFHGKDWMLKFLEMPARTQLLYDKWKAWMHSRIRTGYILLPNGNLPTFFNLEVPEDADESWWLGAWEYERMPQ